MIHGLTLILSYVLSAISVYCVFLAGKQNIRAWTLGFINQSLWLLWIFISGNYGFIFMNLALWYVNFNNYRQWKHKNSLTVNKTIELEHNLANLKLVIGASNLSCSQARELDDAVAKVIKSFKDQS